MIVCLVIHPLIYQTIYAVILVHAMLHPMLGDGHGDESEDTPHSTACFMLQLIPISDCCKRILPTIMIKHCKRSLVYDLISQRENGQRNDSLPSFTAIAKGKCFSGLSVDAPSGRQFGAFLAEVFFFAKHATRSGLGAFLAGFCFSKG